MGFRSEIVALANSYRPSMHLIVGDLMDAPDGFVDPMAAPVTQLNAPVAFVTGNHEYYAGSGAFSYRQSEHKS